MSVGPDWRGRPGLKRLAHRANIVAPKLDPRTKILMLLSLCAASFLADGWPKLSVLLALAFGWALLALFGTPGKRPGLLMWAGTSGAVVGLVLWAAGVPVERLVAPAARMVILLLAGWAFSQSTSTGELASALRKVHCPNCLVLVVVAARSVFNLLAAEVRLAQEAARIRASSGSSRRRPWAPMRNLWRASVAFSARLFLRADQMAAAAESRGFSRPGGRSSLRALRWRPADLAVGTAWGAVLALLCLI